MVLVGDELVPLIFRNLNGKIVGIECWPADHGENFAVARIDRHDRSILSLERLLGRDLQIEVNRELQLLAWYGRRFIEPTDFAAMAIDNRAPRSVLAHQA